MLDLIDRSATVVRDQLEATPNEQGTGNVMALSCGLYDTGKLLRLLATLAHGGGDKFRFVGGNSNPEQFHFFVLREAWDFDQLALLQVFITPNQFIDTPIRRSATTIINSTIRFERAVIQLLASGQESAINFCVAFQLSISTVVNGNCLV